MDIEVTRGVIATLLAEAEKAAPQECCGLLFGGNEQVNAIGTAANVSPEPLVRFEIDPAALFAAYRASRAGGPELMGYYHSHPSGHPVPSATDCEHSTGDLRIWAIIAGGQVAFWRDSGDGFSPLCYRLRDD